MSFKNFGPRQTSFLDILLHSGSAFVAGIIGSVLLLIVVFTLSGFLNLRENFTQTLGITQQTSALFPLILSFVSFLTILSVSIISYKFLSLFEEEQKSTHIQFSHLCLFSIFLYIIMAPIYIWGGSIDYQNILIIFIIHVLLVLFGTHLLQELLNNYFYILLGFYSIFLAFVITGCVVVGMFFYFENGFAKLLSLLFLLPISQFIFLFCKESFALLYYKYYKWTGNDQLGDIFYQIQNENEEEQKQYL